MKRLSIVLALLGLGCSSESDEPASPKSVCTLSDQTQECKCAAAAGEGSQVPSCKASMFTAPGLCCADDAKNECTCFGYACASGKCSWGVPFGNLTETGMYCCTYASSFGEEFGQCRCSQYEQCLDRETQVQECSPDTMPRTCARNLRQVESCEPQ